MPAGEVFIETLAQVAIPRLWDEFSNLSFDRLRCRLHRWFWDRLQVASIVGVGQSP